MRRPRALRRKYGHGYDDLSPIAAGRLARIEERLGRRVTPSERRRWRKRHGLLSPRGVLQMKRHRRHGRALQRRYGRTHGHREAGARLIHELLQAQSRPTVPAPRLSMREEIESERRLRAALRDSDEERGAE